MKPFAYLSLLLLTELAAANPCTRLLSAARALDFNSAPQEYSLSELGHLKVSTPLTLSAPEVKELFAQRPIFSRPGRYSRERDLVFRRQHQWALSVDEKIVADEGKDVVPEWKEFGMTVGRKLEALLRQQLPAEHLVFDTLMLRWVSADIELEYEGPDVSGWAHIDGNTYFNSVLTLFGDGTTYWNSNEAERTEDKFDWERVAEFYPPSGKTQLGEILVLTGHERALALNRPELATLHQGPNVDRHADRVLALFYFRSEESAP